MWVDTHAHIAGDEFADDVADVVRRATEAGVWRVVCVADTLDSAQRTISLARQYNQVLATAGVHPHQASTVNEHALHTLEQLIQDEHICAVGEIGLDFYYDFSPRDVQRNAFRQQIRLAKAADLPVIVHSREAEHAVLDILEEENATKGVLHCYWGDARGAERAIEMGFHIGVGGPITFKKTDDLRDIIERLPLERLIIETDAPYLAPVPYRGKRNEPAYVVQVGHRLAQLMNRSVEEIAEMTTANACRLFGIDAQENKD